MIIAETVWVVLNELYDSFLGFLCIFGCYFVALPGQVIVPAWFLTDLSLLCDRLGVWSTLENWDNPLMAVLNHLLGPARNVVIDPMWLYLLLIAVLIPVYVPSINHRSPMAANTSIIARTICFLSWPFYFRVTHL